MKPSGVMPPELARKWSEVSAYQGFAVDDPTVSVRFEISQRGLSAQVLEPGNRWMVDPKPGVQKGLAISYYSGDTKRPADAGICELETSRSAPIKSGGGLFEKKSITDKPAAKSSGASLRTYRLAVATTRVRAPYPTGLNRALPLSPINRVVAFWKKRWRLVCNWYPTTMILCTRAFTDPFTGNDDHQR